MASSITAIASGEAQSAGPIRRAISLPSRSMRSVVGMPTAFRVENSLPEGSGESGSLRGPALVDIDRHHGEVLAPELGLERIECRHLLAAGDAPGRPDVEKHNFAAEIGQGLGLAVGGPPAAGPASSGPPERPLSEGAKLTYTVPNPVIAARIAATR